MLYHTEVTKKKFHLINLCLKTVISPKPPRLPPLELKNSAGGVSVSTKTAEHILIRPPSDRQLWPKNQSSEMENPGW